MKISVDNKEVFALNDTKKKVMKHVLYEEIFVSDMERRVRYIIETKYKACMERLKAEWIPKLKENKVSSVPLDDDALAELIFSQPGYKNRSQRDNFKPQKYHPDEIETLRPGKDAPLKNK